MCGVRVRGRGSCVTRRDSRKLGRSVLCLPGCALCFALRAADAQTRRSDTRLAPSVTGCETCSAAGFTPAHQRLTS